MAYAIYLLEQLGDTTNSIELDCEGVDFTGFFNVSDISDISKRSDSFSKQITFKGTKKNTSAFGAFPHLNKSTDFQLQNKLGSNYNPIRLVDCLVYENNELLLRGTFTIQSVKVKDGVSYYETVIKGYYIGFAEYVSDKTLADLDLSDLRHRFTTKVIRDSWTWGVEKYDSVTSTYYYDSFEKGKGYVYPYIDYGETFKRKDANYPRHLPYFHVKNFRPAIYVKEYFDRIFSQDGLVGYTYEIKGTDFLKQLFNALIVPNNAETITDKSSLRNFVLSKSTADNNDTSLQIKFDESKKIERAINLQNGLSATLGDNLINKYGTYRGNTSAVFNVEQSFTCDGKLSVKLASMNNGTGRPYRVNMQLVKRKGVSTLNDTWQDPTSWEVVASSSFLLAPGSITNRTVDVEIGEVKFEQGEQIMARMLLDEGQFQTFFEGYVSYSITEATLALPKVTDTGVITYAVEVGSPVVPKAPENIKQLDFVKSIINLFNFYVYSDRLRPRHLIFETYDDYYALSQVASLVALDWTEKVDISKTRTFNSNLSIPKKYEFTYKDDSDYINKDYKERTNRIYANFSFNDALGFTDTRKLELIFSPSPTVEYPNTLKIHPSIFSGTIAEPKPSKSNLRILFYNGVKSGEKYNIAKDIFVDALPDVQVLDAGVSFYPNCGEYFLDEGNNNYTPLYALQFGRPAFTYFGSDDTFHDAPNIYFTRFINQVSQMTHQDMLFLEAEVMLNETDIKDLDLKVPVFIDMQEFGAGYFKVLSVDYKSNIFPAIVKLQKIPV